MSVAAPDTLHDRHDAEATAFEEAAASVVTDGFAGEVAAAVGSIWATRAALAAVTDRATLPPPAAARLRDMIVRTLKKLTPRLRPGLTRTAAGGFNLGVDQAAEVLDTDRRTGGGPHRTERPGSNHRPDLADSTTAQLPERLERDDAMNDVIDTADDRAQALLDEAIELAHTLPMTTEDDVRVITAKATAAANGARRDATWVAERSVAAGVAAETERVADDPDLDIEPGLMWVAERDACLSCLALSGQVVPVGDLFPEVTFADHPLDLPPVPHPPRHPHCRCRVRPYSGPPPSDDISATDPASVFAREARRSVLRGWSGSDSEPARLRAADRLVQRGADLPKSVIDRARRNLADGEFSRDKGRFPQR